MSGVEQHGTGTIRPSSAFSGRMAQVFAPDGLLSKSKDFEFRPQQQEMAGAVARALAEKRPVIVEAGTGVGKSLAYLVPSLTHAVEQQAKAIISTHTINLQEQLVRKDIPIAKKLLGLDLKAVLFKGRGNYLCPRRLSLALNQTGDLFSSSEEAELQAIRDWSERTVDGSLSDLPFTPLPQVWAQVRSEPYLCSKRLCRGLHCFYQDLRQRVDEAQVVVLNHTLFFTLLAGHESAEDANTQGFLFPNDFVVFDEAHTLENVAARQLGLNLSHASVTFDLHRLYNPRSKKGLFQALGYAAGAQGVTAVIEELEFFFNEVENRCRFQRDKRLFRVRERGFAPDTVQQQLLQVEQLVARVSDDQDDENLKLELEDVGRRVRDLRFSLRSFLDQSLEEHVYWVEKSAYGREAVSLNAAPLDIAERFQEIFFSRSKPIVLTSATLGVGEGNLAYYKKRMGAEAVESIQIGSPFDYRKQMRFYVVKSMPDPNADSFEEALQHWIEHFVTQSSGRAFVLFTSYRLMQQVAARMQRFFQKRGWMLLVQGSGKPRSLLVETFKEEISSVLFGTDSFWTGVDVPGEALSNVIVTRLPFAVPDHPLTASRLERIEESGGNPFMDYSVPEAVLKLRQGVGRLIRSTKDRGIVVILDNRVLTRRYGKIFMQALPPARVQVVE